MRTLDEAAKLLAIEPVAFDNILAVFDTRGGGVSENPKGIPFRCEELHVRMDYTTLPVIISFPLVYSFIKVERSLDDTRSEKRSFKD